MACGAVDGAGHGERAWPARAGAGWGVSIGEAAASPGRPAIASASATPNIFGAATSTAPRATVMHNMLGNWDVDNNPTVGNAGKRAPRMLDSFADQRDGSNSWGISVQRQPAEEGGGGLINQHDSAVNLGITNVADVDEREPTGMHDNAIDRHDGSSDKCNTVHRLAAETHDSLVIEQAPRKRFAFHVVGERPRQGSSAETHAGLVRAHKQTVICVACDSLVCLQQARAAAGRRRDTGLAAADGCYSCSIHGRRARWTRTQRDMANAVLDGRRVIVERPAVAKGRMPQQMLPRAEARAHALWVLACLE